MNTVWKKLICHLGPFSVNSLEALRDITDIFKTFARNCNV